MEHHFTSLHLGEGGSTTAFHFYIIVDDKLGPRSPVQGEAPIASVGQGSSPPGWGMGGA